MKLCPTCGEVYPDQSAKCRAHDAVLLTWAEVHDTDSRPDTAVEDDTGPFSDTALVTQPGDLTDPEVPLHAAPTPPNTVLVAPSLLAASLAPARILGRRYRLGDRIGIGGYGAVFDAYDERLGKRVAVKVLSPVVSRDPEIVRRFKREAIAASRVRHECIVDVTDFDIDAAGISFIVMEYLDGSDLSDVLAENGPLAPDRALTIATQCASALTAAHASGILHRDLKPANIFLVKTASRSDFVKIIDFGIAKVSNADGQYSNVTSASKVVGTPFYMAPEQAQGHVLDQRVDVYALGIMLFEMLVDERPFIGASALEILTNAMIGPRVAPSSLRPELAAIAGLDQLVLRAIAANKDQRFPSMRQFGEAIIACLSALDATRVLGLPSIAQQPVRAGSDGAGRPDPRAVPATELVDPLLLESSSGEVTAPHEPAAPGRGRFAALGTALIAAALAAFWVSSADDGHAPSLPSAPHASAEAPPDPPAPIPMRAPALLRGTRNAADAAPAVLAEDAAAAPAGTTIHVTSSPPGATVSSRRRGALGATPLDVMLAADEPEDELTLRHAGHIAETIRIDPTSDATLHVSLAVERKPRPKAARPPAASKPAKPELGIKDW